MSLSRLLSLRTLLTVLALLGLASVAGSFALGAEQPSQGSPGDAPKVLAAFQVEHPATFEIDLAARYGGRFELLDPRRTLPTWQRHAPNDAIAAHAALRDCSEPSVFVNDPDLAKAIDWHAAACAHSRPLLETLAARPPFMHPSGSSYASLLTSEAPRPDEAWLIANRRAFHVLELRDLPATLQSPEERALAALPPAAFARILEGDATVLTNTWIMHVSRNQYGPTRLTLRPRDAWLRTAERAGVTLGPMSGACAEPESPVLCWRALPVSGAHRGAARVLLAAGMLLLAAGIALSIAMVVRARRAAERERVFLLRALTHELRSPVTAMRLDVEPLRASFDALPDECQEPLLRLSAGIERLSRVLEVTGRALSLFDSRGEAAASPIAARAIPSVKAYFEELREEWPEDVVLHVPEEEQPFVTDPDWLRVAVKNLVENASKHGEGEVHVRVRASPEELVVRVTDEGRTPALLLADVTRPFTKRAGSTGLGLGLSLVARIVERQGGRLRHEPDPTTFELRMPRGTER